jgi:hypothetical protein
MGTPTPMSMRGRGCYSRSVLGLVWGMMAMVVEVVELRLRIREEVGDWET